jgi:hypothetical protein
VGGTNPDSTTSNTQIQPPAPETNTDGENDGVGSAPVEEVSEELETLGLVCLATFVAPPAAFCLSWLAITGAHTYIPVLTCAM